MLSLDFIIQQTILGIMVGTLYAAISIGFSLSFGLARIINIAHAGFYALAAYLTYAFITISDNFAFSIIFASLIVCSFSFLVEKSLISKVYGKHIDLSLVIGFGILFMISSLIKYIWTPEPKSLSPPAILSGQFFIGRITIPVYYIFILIASSCIYITTWIFVNKTMIGRTIKAGIDDLERVTLLGINISRIFTVNYVYSSFLAALGGGLMAPLISLHPAIGHAIILIMFSIVVVGGMGSIFGTLVAGIIVGLSISYTAIYNPSIAEGVAYLLMIIVLLIKPEGLFKK